MKYVLLLIIILSACSVLTTCRSSHVSDRQYDSNVEANTSLQTNKKDSTARQSEQKDASITARRESRYLRIVTLDSIGRIRIIQEEWRDIGRTKLSTSDGRTSETSLNEQKKDSTADTHTDIKEINHAQNTTDSRPVQGSEWLWIAIGGGVAIAIIITLIFYYLKKR